MRGLAVVALFLALALGIAGCVETVRCPAGQIFDEGGDCVPIPDGGPDAGPDGGA